MRKYNALTLNSRNDVLKLQQIAPAIPLFEDAFTAFAHGTLIATEHGPVAVEDLMPGDRLCTGDGDLQPLLWKGELQTIPHTKELTGHDTGLFRLQAESFGMARPSRDLVLGSPARVIERNTRLTAQAGADIAAIPVAEYADGERAFAVTPSIPVTLCHLHIERHCGILANGLECETFHPGHVTRMSLSIELAKLFLSLFPHINSFSDFGPEGFARLQDTCAA